MSRGQAFERVRLLAGRHFALCAFEFLLVDPDGPYMGHVDQARVRRWIINTPKSLHFRPGNAC